MQQNTDPLVSDTAASLWKYCRIIAIVNEIYCGVVFILKVFYLLSIATICNYHSSINEVPFLGIVIGSIFEFCEVDNLLDINLTGLLIFWIWSILICVLYIIIMSANTSLRSTDMPTDKKQIKKWLHVHKGALVINIYDLIRMILNPDTSIFDIVYSGITCIVLMIELIAVGKLNKELKISADRRNSHFQTSNMEPIGNLAPQSTMNATLHI